MTDIVELEKRIDESGYRIDFICKRLGITYQGFQNKAKGRTEFKQSEIATLSEILNLSLDEINTIFFTSKCG